mmetsp:Transcript_28148/g.71245  ORF Transcript_28148/g.71245 Transcript_28148/m.71245 type:complete len:327 (+) Transcript_28148:459-1439(+)
MCSGAWAAKAPAGLGRGAAARRPRPHREAALLRRPHLHVGPRGAVDPVSIVVLGQHLAGVVPVRGALQKCLVHAGCQISSPSLLPVKRTQFLGLHLAYFGTLLLQSFPKQMRLLRRKLGHDRLTAFRLVALRPQRLHAGLTELDRFLHLRNFVPGCPKLRCAAVTFTFCRLEADGQGIPIGGGDVELFPQRTIGLAQLVTRAPKRHSSLYHRLKFVGGVGQECISSQGGQQLKAAAACGGICLTSLRSHLPELGLELPAVLGLLCASGLQTAQLVLEALMHLARLNPRGIELDAKQTHFRCGLISTHLERADMLQESLLRALHAST